MKSCEPFSDCFATKPATQVDEKNKTGGWQLQVWINNFAVNSPSAAMRKEDEPINHYEYWHIVIREYREQEHKTRKEIKTAKEMVQQIPDMLLLGNTRDRTRRPRWESMRQ